MFFKFLLENVSERFDNYWFHEIEYPWSVNINKEKHAFNLKMLELPKRDYYDYGKSIS